KRNPVSTPTTIRSPRVWRQIRRGTATFYLDCASKLQIETIPDRLRRELEPLALFFLTSFIQAKLWDGEITGERGGLAAAIKAKNQARPVTAAVGFSVPVRAGSSASKSLPISRSTRSAG